jgi:uncharacterized protein
MRSRHLLILATALALPALGCMPASWGAGALLHPSRRHVTVARPVGAEDVTIQGDGVKLSGWLFHRPTSRRGTVIYLHGSADNRVSGLSVAERFAPRGFDVLLYDSRAHGESEGDACTYGYYEKRDLSRAIDTLPVQPVLVIGVSLGGAVALQAAALDPRIAGVIAVATFSDLRTVATERAPSIASKADLGRAFDLAESTAHFRVDDVSPLVAARSIRVPVLLIHGQDDHETVPAHSQRVFDALGGRKQLFFVPGAGHDDALNGDAWRTIDAWVDAVLPAPAANQP